MTNPMHDYVFETQCLTISNVEDAYIFSEGAIWWPKQMAPIYFEDSGEILGFLTPSQVSQMRARRVFLRW